MYWLSPMLPPPSAPSPPPPSSLLPLPPPMASAVAGVALSLRPSTWFPPHITPNVQLINFSSMISLSLFFSLFFSPSPMMINIITDCNVSPNIGFIFQKIRSFTRSVRGEYWSYWISYEGDWFNHRDDCINGYYCAVTLTISTILKAPSSVWAAPPTPNSFSLFSPLLFFFLSFSFPLGLKINWVLLLLSSEITIGATV